MLNLAVLLEDSARRYPDRDALVLGDKRLTYAQVNAQANRIAHLLVSRGVEPGDKVALSCPNILAFPIVYNGILKAGAIVVPLNVMLKEREIAYHLTDSEAKVYFCFEGSPEMPIGQYGHGGFEQTATCRDMILISAAEGAPSSIPGVETLEDALGALPDSTDQFDSVVREPTDGAVILYTSGTTGKPKGAELTHSNMVLNALSANRLFESTPTQLDRCLITLPLFHSFGQTVAMNSAISVGSTLVLVPRFDAAGALALMERENITVFAGVPTMYWGLLGALDGANVDVEKIARNMRKAVSGGAALPVEILTRFKERFGVQILEGYGLSETSPLALFSDPERDPRPGSIGVPVWGIEARLVDADWNTVSGPDVVGELAIRGHNIMKGYCNRPEATAEVMRNGWFRTGDLARVDEDGFFYIVDRAKDMIVRGGFNVYPREVEEVLLSHEAVSLVAVIGVPDERHGEEVVAFVILEPTAQITEAELVAWSKEQMAAYKYPRRVEFVPTLPMTATGKILKRELGAVQALL
ncbi:long-chain-fatty-acid--CoA ligase [Rhodococcus sp. OK302]|uniref:long-chain-fatty-acid--CoA ligase n=1 Tax=Rhodococcus sp. OK302 TaxID=1882769 RepID=UPI000B93ADC4|nr:long-chain fatty acid--CoA ligase [Rhodococcus sp. OK302]